MTSPPAESLSQLLGGKRAALEASVPPVAFLLGWLLSNESLWWGCGAAVAAAVVVAVLGLARGDKPRAVVLGLLLVVVSALIAGRTGNAADFFLLRLLSNAASALAWAASIALRWPLLGVVLGAVIGTKATWRKDPVLLRAYSRASWVWVLQYLVRIAVFVPLYLAGQTTALGIAQVALTYPLIVVCLAVSGWVLFRTIPAGHPGVRHPQLVGPKDAGSDASGPQDADRTA
ncbi:DUF3159 domain-containing protein [Galactobacter caseinivorans]|uniref:DUF3159 domain-containing protein n=1 Tax=Galactobacter caseinivorans TaxID=2676123 RepID=A0A496PHQ8_9MICC|nr:DUF3159 domain-containing protein [Galactobacter caseinivorans]RKW70009.1 DUF3159 domain-containing protein [Galactobacter caseinivorans]